MANFNRALLAIQLFCYWYFLSAGFVSVLGALCHFVGTVACALSVYNGLKWHYAHKDGEGLAWAVIGIMVFVGFSARWLVSIS